MPRHPVTAEIGGIVSRIERERGDSVATGDPFIFLESMKMEIPVPAPVNGKLVELLVTEGDVVIEGQSLAIIETS